MAFPTGARVFVDESKSRGYYVAAAAAAPGDVVSIESRLRKLRTGGRSAIHFNDEGNRRDALLREFCEMNVRVRVYVMRGAKDSVARPALLRTLVDDLVTSSARDLTLERDASVEMADRRVLYDRLGELNARGTLPYSHAGRRDQPMLWIPDAIAWCFQAGGTWPAKVAPILDEVQHINRP